tara:strand:- start:1987 stop:3378 length:1392 start_codon:yes stop_codon:yes gene_type:complete
MTTQQPHHISYNRSIVYIIGTIAALAGLLFGVDIGVISIANQFIQKEFMLDTSQVEWVVSSILFGAVLGALLANPISHKFGRRRALLLSAGIFVVGSILCAYAPSYRFLINVRFILGIALGIASFTAPIYLSEIAPKRIRGALVTLFQLMITIGILLAFVSDTAFSYTGNWRAMLGVVAIPSAIMFIGVLVLPYSPRWLMLIGHRDRAKAVLKRVLTNQDEIDQELNDIEANLTKSQVSWSLFKKPYFRRVLFLGLALQFIQIMTGMNTMMYYAPKIFELAGYASSTQQAWGTVLLGVVNVLTTVIALFVVDRWGRRPLMFFGLTFMTLGMLLLGYMFILGPVTPTQKYLAITGMLLFIFGFAISLGPVIWLLCAEIFPLRARDMGVMFTTGMNWLCCAMLGNKFPTLITALGPAHTFWMFSGICVLSVVFINYFAPETKNVPLETIERHLISGKKLRHIGRA